MDINSTCTENRSREKQTTIPKQPKGAAKEAPKRQKTYTKHKCWRIIGIVPKPYLLLHEIPMTTKTEKVVIGVLYRKSCAYDTFRTEH